jgi:hypothetical protein
VGIAESWRRWRERRRAAEVGNRILDTDAVVRLPAGVGREVRVEAGRVVVTFAGDPVDHVLEAGDALDLSGRRRALAWALLPSRIELAKAALAAPRVTPASALLAR